MSEFRPDDLVIWCDCGHVLPEGTIRCPRCDKFVSAQDSVRYSDIDRPEPPPEPVAADDTTCANCGAELDEFESLCGQCNHPRYSDPCASGEAPETEPAPPDLPVYDTGQTVNGLEVIERLSVETSGEASIWRVRMADGGDAVLKAYRGHQTSRIETLEQFRAIDDPAVVRILEVFVWDGCDHELQEYLPNGTLATWIASHRGAGAPPEVVRGLVRQMARSLDLMHEHRLYHRDITPSNFLLRSSSPPRIALGDFDLARIDRGLLPDPDTSRLVTPHYAAPEAFGGEATAKTDWWSVGIIVLEMLTGRHPLAEIDSQAVQEYHKFDAVEIDEDLADDWKLLLSGLLTQPIAPRWGGDEVRRWLTGDRSIPAHRSVGRLIPKYTFKEHEVFEAATLSRVLAQDWALARKHLAGGHITHWCARSLCDQDLAVRLKELEDDPGIPDDDWRLAIARMLLDPGAPLALPEALFSTRSGARRDDPPGDEELGSLLEVDEVWRTTFYIEALRMACSSVPRWVALMGDPTLEGWARPRAELLEVLPGHGVDVGDRGVRRLVVANPDLVVARANERRLQFQEATDPALQPLLDSERLDLIGAIRLLSALDQFLTPEQVRRRDRLREMEERGLPYDRAEAARILELKDREILDRARAWRRNITRSWHDGYDRLLRAREWTVTDATLLLSAPSSLFMTREEAAARRRAKIRAAIPHVVVVALVVAGVGGLQQWEAIHLRGYWLGLFTPVLGVAIGLGLILALDGTNRLWDWFERDAADWRSRDTRLRGGGYPPGPGVGLYGTALGFVLLILVVGYFLWPGIRDDRYDRVLSEATVAGADGRLEAALDRLTFATSRHPARVDGRLELANAYRRLGRLDDADRTLAEVAGVAPFHPLLHKYMGLLYLERGWTHASRLALERAHFLDPSNLDVAGRLGCAYRADGDEAEARRVLALAGIPSVEVCP